MKLIPPIRDLIVPRPGDYQSATKHYVPQPSAKKEWDAIYKAFSQYLFQPPIPLSESLFDQAFGFFGVRFHPGTGKPKYFHIGFDFHAKARTPVIPVIDGILEYSGFALVNGNYVLLSHPEIKTEDGFIMYSAYMHLRSLDIKFSSYQKMLREISLHTYPQIPISKEKVIGAVGCTGCSSEYSPTHLHLQIELRHKDGTVVAIDPTRVLSLPHGENQTANITNSKKFVKFIHENKQSLTRWMRMWKDMYEGL